MTRRRVLLGGDTKAATSHELSTAARAFAWFVGMAGLGSGAAGAFAGDLEAPPVALLAVGVIFLLVGMSGRLPRRLKIGDNEAEWEPVVAAAFEDLAEQVPSSKRGAVVDALDDLATVAPHAAASAASRLFRGQARLDAVRAVANRLGIEIHEPANVRGKSSDLTLVSQSGKKLWVILSTTGVRGWQLGSAQRLMEEIKQADTAYVGVLLVGSRHWGSSQHRSTPSGTVWVVELGDDMDDQELERTITTALAEWDPARDK